MQIRSWLSSLVSFVIDMMAYFCSQRARLLCLILICGSPPLIIHAQGQQEQITQSPERSVSVGFLEAILPAQFSVRSPYVDFNIAPYVSVGTHRNALGIHTNALFTLPDLAVLKHVYVFLQAGYVYAFDDLGIPEPSHAGFFSGALGVSVGAEGVLQNNFVPLGVYRHNIMFQYEYFLDSLNTSQASGILGYFYSTPAWLVGLILENDTFGFMSQDRFRTGAGEILSLFDIDGAIWGVGVGVTVWGGTTEDEELRGFRGATVDITDDYGGLYSHGVLYVAGYFDSIKLSIGWDSEMIRQAFQNSIHFFINQSAVGAIPNIPDRFFIQIQLNSRFSLY